MSEMSSENNLNTSEVPEKADEDEIEAKAKCPRQQDSNRRCIPLKACKNCGKVGRYEHYCPAEEETCQLCGKIGHWARVCRYLGRYLNTNKSRKYNNDYKKNFRRRNGRKWNRNSRKFDAPNNLNKINNQFGNGRCDNNRSANQSTVIKNGDSKKRANYERERTFSNKNKRNRNNRRNNSWKDGDKDDTDDDKCILNEKNQRKTDKKCADHSEEGNAVNDSSRANFYENTENFDKTESQDEKIFDQEKKEDPKNSEENNLEEKGECDFVESSTRKNTLYSVADDDRPVFDKETKYAYITVGQSRYDPRANDADSHSNENSTKNDEKISETASGYSDKPENDNDTIGLKRKLANSFYKNGKYEAALSHYSCLIELCPKEPVHFNNRCACYMALGQYKNAFIDAVTVVNLDSSCIKGHCRLIKCAVLLGEITAAELNLSTLSQLDPMNEFVAEERKKLRDLQEYIGKHEFAANVSNYPDALESINKCLLISPHCLRYKIKKAEYSALLTRYDEAQKLVGEILQEDFDNIEAKYISGICLYAFDANEAMNYLKDLLRLDPDNEKMQKLYRKAKRLSNTMKDGYYLFASMDYSSAHLLYKSTLGLERDHTRIRAGLYQNMGHASYNMGNFQRAIEEYTEAINFDDTNLNALKRRGMSYMRMKEYEEAIADFERVCKLNPGDDSQKFIEDAEKLLASVKKDFYEILGVSRDASIEKIKKAYKDKAILHHPDRHSKAAEEQRRKHERKFKDITLAYRDILERCRRKLSFTGNS